MSDTQVTVVKPQSATGRKTSGGGQISFYFQKDRFVCGTFTMPPGTALSAKGAMTHPGDEIYYVVKGPAYCDLPDQGKKIKLEPGEGLTIPAGTKHIPHNLPGQADAIVFFVCTDWP